MGDKLIVLKSNSIMENIEELENKYSKKFGCKVVILESGIELVGESDGNTF